jgi:hypothetical protein
MRLEDGGETVLLACTCCSVVSCHSATAWESIEVEYKDWLTAHARAFAERIKREKAKRRRRKKDGD